MKTNTGGLCEYIYERNLRKDNWDLNPILSGPKDFTFPQTTETQKGKGSAHWEDKQDKNLSLLLSFP